ncbi:GNAT family N-acetyltransferase [Chengkuizengella axinellae]|uniref:GNAT family protein n=1 Tax=Chengkuizengella axinellae TaxID=3064388 RepID=A0ABT9J054_9BACL|nr:GNAT family protein [Chengkuizengella sp. 2205SS18-9]MDP5274858.1 GNAT family protein [Chengkuizengella sp. 2205SS18-9]
MSQNEIYLVGSKVILRDLTLNDIKSIYDWTYLAKDREHLKWNAPYHDVKPMSYEQFLIQEQEHLNRVNTERVRNKLVIEADGKLIGRVGWYWVDETTNWLCNGLVIFDSNYWSGGYGTDAFEMWTNFIFENMNVARVGISTWSGNERMIRLARKVGMVEEGCIRKARIVKGKYYDSIKMGVLREEWEER